MADPMNSNTPNNYYPQGYPPNQGGPMLGAQPTGTPKPFTPPPGHGSPSQPMMGMNNMPGHGPPQGMYNNRQPAPGLMPPQGLNRSASAPHVPGQNAGVRPPPMNGMSNTPPPTEGAIRPAMPSQPPRFGPPPTSLSGTSLNGPQGPPPTGPPPPMPGMFNNGPPQPYPQGAPPRPMGPPTGAMGPGHHGPPMSRPTELPVPYNGHAQYSHQVHQPGITPNSSEPPSQNSSRGPSPIPGMKYDTLEGQFSNSPMTPKSASVIAGPPRYPGQGSPMQPPHPPTQGINPMQATIPPQPPTNPMQATMPPQPQTNPMQATMPPQPQTNPMQANIPPQPPTNPMQANIPHPPTSQIQPHFQPPQNSQMPPNIPSSQMSNMPPNMHPPAVNPMQPNMPQPPSSQGITGRRVYPQQMEQPGQTAPQMPPPPTSAYPGQGSYTAPPGGQPAPANNMGYPQPPAQPPAPGYPPQPNNAMSGQPMSGYNSNNTQPQPNNMGQMNAQFSNMRMQQPDVNRPINLLQERQLIPPTGVENARPDLPNDYKKVTSSPDIFQCTLNALPNTQSLLNKARLPLGLLIHPFKDLAQLPVIQSSVIVRCRSCRTYINPFVSFTDMRRWKCNLCYRVNELPEEFNYDPVSKTYGEPQRRPEIKSSTIEFIAPSEYMLRPPQPAVYVFVLDVSFNAIETGYLPTFCQTLLEELDRIPGDSRTQIGFITFDSALHFYNLSEEMSRPQMMVVSDVDEIFLPSPDGLLVNMHESKDLITDLITQLPDMFNKNSDTGSALGAALQSAYKLMSPTGGRVTVVQTQLPTVGPGGLKNREDPNERAGKKISHLGPATDFYKKLALDCSAQQIAVDLFLLNAQYADVSTIACASKYSGGCIHSFPGLHSISNAGELERFEGVLKRYLSRKIGFEAVMRIRCTRGLSIHTFHGNFFVRSTDLLSLPNINPDAGFGMQMSIEDTLEGSHACAQAALLYTSSKGERRIRVHTLCLPVTNTLSEVHKHADQKAVIGLIAKMAVDKSLSQSMSDARDALVNSAIDMLTSYGGSLTSAQRLGQLPAPMSLKLMPLYVLALMKSVGFRIGSSTKLDDRVIALEEFKTRPLQYVILSIYPNLYPVHMLDDKNGISKGDNIIPQPPILQLTSANTDRHGAYLMDRGNVMYLWIGAAVSDNFCQEVFGVPNFHAVPDAASEIPDMDNPTCDRLRLFIGYLNEQRPFPASLTIVKEDSRNRSLFLQHMIEDRTESTFSYYEFLQHLQKEVRT